MAAKGLKFAFQVDKSDKKIILWYEMVMNCGRRGLLSNLLRRAVIGYSNSKKYLWIGTVDMAKEPALKKCIIQFYYEPGTIIEDFVKRIKQFGGHGGSDIMIDLLDRCIYSGNSEELPSGLDILEGITVRTDDMPENIPEKQVELNRAMDSENLVPSRRKRDTGSTANKVPEPKATQDSEVPYLQMQSESEQKVQNATEALPVQEKAGNDKMNAVGDQTVYTGVQSVTRPVQTDKSNRARRAREAASFGSDLM